MNPASFASAGLVAVESLRTVGGVLRTSVRFICSLVSSTFDDESSLHVVVVSFFLKKIYFF